MYDELYAAWRLEAENGELGRLPPDFYARLTDYLRHAKEETKMAEARNLRFALLEHERANASRMTQELIGTRYRKIAKMIVVGLSVPMDCLASEEQRLVGGVSPSAEVFSKFASGIVEGQPVKMDVAETTASSEPPVVHVRITLRFLKPVPEIIGSDMKSYGPFQAEDVASVPQENARMLVKQGLAKQVEVP
jgi:DNA replication factor GINS